MQPTSRAPVSARESNSRLAPLLPLAVGGPVIGAIAAVVGQVEGIVEVGWFDLENLPHLAPLAARWVTVFVVSLGLYGSVIGAGGIAKRVRSHQAVVWGRSLLAFMSLLSWLVALHFTVVVGALSDLESTWPTVPYEAHLILVASLTPLAWLAAFGRRTDLRAARAIFVSVLLTLVVALVVLDPFLLRMWATDLGILRPLPEVQLMITDRVVDNLPYLVPIGPILWSTFGRWRELQS